MTREKDITLADFAFPARAEVSNIGILSNFLGIETPGELLGNTSMRVHCLVGPLSISTGSQRWQSRQIFMMPLRRRTPEASNSTLLV